MTRRTVLALLVVLSLFAPAIAGSDETREKPDKATRLANKRDAIDYMARQSLERLFKESETAGKLYDECVGYAVFDSFKAAVIISGGGGVGVAFDRSTKRKTYMKMGTVGIGLGLGGQSYQVVFLFETREAMERFVNKGWQADASANAVAGTKGSNHDASFSHGLAVFQLTNKGLMAQADISGTKYWKHKKLNGTARRSRADSSTSTP
jgi:lipid-binding SYLF domain-containing protein